MFILLEAVVEVHILVAPAAQEVLAEVVLEHLILPLVEQLILVAVAVDREVLLPHQVTELLVAAAVAWLFFVIQTHMLLHQLPQDRV
jgi:hypothetical protein